MRMGVSGLGFHPGFKVGARLFMLLGYLTFLHVPSPVVLATAAEARTAHSFGRTLDAIAPRILRQYSVPGVAVALIKNGEVVWMKGYGVADTTSTKPITPETLFNVGSISKTATGWGLMRLVDGGKINLDAPVDSYLKRWRLPPSSFDNDQVTIRRLLSHTAGISIHDYADGIRICRFLPSRNRCPGKRGRGKFGLSPPPAPASGTPVPVTRSSSL